MKTILGIVGAIILFFAVMFGLNAVGMVSYSFFGKWQEEIRHDIQTESTAYRAGMQNNLQQMLNDYNIADSAGKQAILAGVRAQYAQSKANHIEEMPAHLRDFLRTAGVY